MAKPVSFNKRELEKKRQKKRQDKQNRKEERKSGSGNSFEDMIAYVDENGMITDTPPELGNKQEIDVEAITVSTPRQEKVEEAPLKGRVEHFNQDKGYGFIKNLQNAEKYFFHISQAPDRIAEGDKVYFELEKGNKGMNAVRIVPAE